jgi:hypothetical protein
MYKIEKFRIPTIWVDTSFINNVAKIKKGEFVDNRYIDIFDCLLNRISDKKLICPNAHQDEEFLTIDRLNEDCYKIVHKLSIGLEFYTPREIRDLQFKRACEGFMKKEKIITLTCTGYFIPQVEETFNSNDKYFVVVEKTPFKKLYKDVVEGDKSVTKQWQVLKNKNLNKYTTPITYEEQLEREFLGELEALKTCLGAIINKENIPQNFKVYLTYFTHKIKPIVDLENIPIDIEGFKNVIKFYKSSYYRTLPIENISCKLNAHLLTSYGNKKLKSSDQMDITYLSNYLPVSHLVICDKSMKDSCLKLGFDKEYDVKIFSIKDYKLIIDYLTF